jgi:hypothetical protein
VKSSVEYYTKKLNGDVSIDPTVRVSNIINVMSDMDTEYLFKKVCQHLDGVPEDEEVEVVATNESNEMVAGKNVFKSFLRMLAALGLKENKPDWVNTPNDFLVYYQFDGLSFDNIKMVMTRFKSLVPFIERLENNNDQKLYFGIKLDLTFEYGIYVNDHQYMGRFKMNKANMNWLFTLETSASSSLKRELVDLSIEKMKMFSVIKKNMLTFVPGKYKQKLVPTIKDDIITFSYYGIGRWNSGEIEQEDLDNLKVNFKKWASGFKWSYKAKVNIIAQDFWIKYCIKIV